MKLLTGRELKLAGIKIIREASLDDFREPANWISSVWERLEQSSITDDELPNVWNEIERAIGMESTNIIDSGYSADKLHYYSNGTMDNNEVVDFLNSFHEIKGEVDRILERHLY